ncbi:MAG: glycosyltransferase family 4 protein [Geminicoccaceae bacterium]|nr:glycosyltransferase family 4 protein [Geminicoccaceae bacterium]
MRVLCLMTGPLDYALEVAQAAATIARAMLVGPRAELEPRREELDPALALAPLSWPRHRSLANLRLVREVLARIAAFRPDLVHFLGDSVLWLHLALPFLRDRPRIVTVHDVELHPGDVQSKRVPRASVHGLRRAATVLVVHGPEQRRLACARHGRPIEEVRILPHPALDRFARLASRLGLAPRPDRPPTVLFFGRLMRYKGLPFLVEAWRRVTAIDGCARLVVAGAGPDAAWLRSALAGLPRCELREGHLPEPEVAQLFLDCDLVVLPYIEASQSGVLALAAAMGRPVVASEIGDLAHTVRATGMGRLVPPADPEALARALAELLTDADARAGLAAAATAAARGPLSRTAVAECLRGIYAEALARHARRAA